jgi:hypothetical protein
MSGFENCDGLALEIFAKTARYGKKCAGLSETCEKFWLPDLRSEAHLGDSVRNFSRLANYAPISVVLLPFRLDWRPSFVLLAVRDSFLYYLTLGI